MTAAGEQAAGSGSSQQADWADDQPPRCTPAAAAPVAPSAAVDADEVKYTVSNEHADEYIQSSAATCPPLVRLQVYGICCPFIETEEEHDARTGASNLQNYPITWYRKKLLSDVANDVKGAVPGSSGFIDGIGSLFSGGSAASSGGSPCNKKQQKKKHEGASIPMAHVGVPATLSVVDTDDHGPVIQIRSLDGFNDPSNVAAQKAMREYITSGRPWWEDPAIRDRPPCKVIPLYMVDKVAAGWSLTNDATAGGIKLFAAPPSKGFLSGNGPELLRFDTLGGGGSTFGDANRCSPNEPNRYSDKVIVQLKSLIDWNRRRIARDIKKGNIGVAPKSTSPGYVSIT